jgi:hypothetical protein
MHVGSVSRSADRRGEQPVWVADWSGSHCRRRSGIGRDEGTGTSLKGFRQSQPARGGGYVTRSSGENRALGRLGSIGGLGDYRPQPSAGGLCCEAGRHR